MELAIYIKELLYNNDILAIPGFGGFSTNYRAAEINTEEHSISPPVKYLVYDKDIVDSRDVFVNHVAQQKKLTKKNAEKFVKQQVEALNKKLNEGETILLEGIGYFSKENEIIRFDRDHDSNFFTETYGLSKIDYKTVEVSLEPQQPTVYNQIGHKKHYSNILIIIGSLLLVGGAFAVYLYYPDLKERLFKAKPNIKVVVTPNASSDSTKTSEVSDTTKSSDLEKFFDSKTDKKKALAIDSVKKEVKPSSGISYFIIAGSFKTYQRATILAKKLQKDGFKAEVLQFGEDLYRVSLGEYGDKDQALTEFKKISASKGNEAVWLLSK